MLLLNNHVYRSNPTFTIGFGIVKSPLCYSRSDPEEEPAETFVSREAVRHTVFAHARSRTEAHGGPVHRSIPSLCWLPPSVLADRACVCREMWRRTFFSTQLLLSPPWGVPKASLGPLVLPGPPGPCSALSRACLPGTLRGLPGCPGTIGASLGPCWAPLGPL